MVYFSPAGKEKGEMKGRFSGETNPLLLSQHRGLEAVLGEGILNDSLFLHEPIKPYLP